MTPLLGFAPDIESTTPGVLVDCVQMIPYQSGIEAAPTPSTPSATPALAAECRGAVVVTKIDGSRRVLSGTTTHLYELTGGAWADRKSATYTGGADTRWSFAQFGDSTIATNRADAMQVSAAGVFANIGGSSPRAEVVFTVGAFVMALNVNDGAEKQDGWRCCAIYDAADWAASVTTQSANGRLVTTPGPLTAGLALGEYAVAYKATSVYVGQYVGAPTVWDWILVQGGESGCVGKEALCDIEGAHFYVGNDNFWVFDGTRPAPVGDDQVRQWFFNNADSSNRYKTKCVYDRAQNRVWIYYPSRGASSCDSALVYHIKNKQWGRSNRAIEATLNYVSAGLTYDTWSSAGATYDTLPNIPYDSAYWLAGAKALTIFNASHQLQTMTGDAAASSFTTGDAGDDDRVTTLRSVRLRFAAGRSPTTGSISTEHKMTSGAAYSAGVTNSINDGKFDVMRSARWHRATVSFTGPVRVTGIKADLVGAGQR